VNRAPWRGVVAAHALRLPSPARYAVRPAAPAMTGETRDPRAAFPHSRDNARNRRATRHNGYGK